MPLIDLDSMSGLQLREEAKYWAIEPSDYPNDKDLKKAIRDKREVNAARHPVTEQDVEAGMAKEADTPGSEATQKKQKPVADLKDKDVKDSVQEATISRPTPGEPETRAKQSEEAQEQTEAKDTAVGKPKKG